jgi:hypothetical protein
MLTSLKAVVTAENKLLVSSTRENNPKGYPTIKIAGFIKDEFSL